MLFCFAEYFPKEVLGFELEQTGTEPPLPNHHMPLSLRLAHHSVPSGI